MSETAKADIVERLRKNAEQMYVNELRSDAADAGIYRSWKNTATEAAAEIERLRALSSRDAGFRDGLEAAREIVADAMERLSDCGVAYACNDIIDKIDERALKKDTDNG